MSSVLSVFVGFLPTLLLVVLGVLAVWYFFGGSSKPKSATGTTSTATFKGKPKKVFTKEEVLKHNKPTDLWLVIDKKVYDLTPYFDEHPGGEAILRNAGKDSSQGFHGPQHPKRVAELVEDFYLGELAE